MVEVEYGECMTIVLARQNLLQDRTKRGSQFTRQLSDSADLWLEDLFNSAVGERPDICLLYTSDAADE